MLDQDYLEFYRDAALIFTTATGKFTNIEIEASRIGNGGNWTTVGNTLKWNGTPSNSVSLSGCSLVGLSSIIFVIEMPTVTVIAGDNMTKTTESGDESQSNLSGAIRDVVYTADDGYYFPEDYSVAAVNGISVTRDSYTQITVSGTPTADATITLTAPTAKTTPAAPTTAAAVDCTTSDNNDGKLTGVTTAMEYKKSDAESWTVGTGSDITGLVPGTYYVRVKATDTSLASDNQLLTIKAFEQKETATVTKAPTAKTLTYNGKAQELVTAGEATGGEMQYALGTKDAASEKYTASIPTATEAGTYYVWYMVKGDANHLDSEARCVTVTISEQPDGDDGDGGDDDGEIPDDGDDSGDDQVAGDVVEDLYDYLLGRTYDDEGKSGWLEHLDDRSMSLANVIRAFLSSPEYQGKGNTPEETVKLLYQAVLGREGDSEGIAHWTEELENGMTQDELIAGFLLSKETQARFEKLGLDIGGVYADGSFLEPGLRSFVERMYRTALGRESEQKGFYAWADAMHFGELAPEDLPAKFFFSEEYQSMEKSDEAFVTDCYRAVLGREPDEAGMQHWLGILKEGADRAEVLKGFTDSKEFALQLQSFGL